MQAPKTFVILDNIRSAENVGSIFRTADATGVSKIYLVGITPAPTDRFGREQKKIQKTALGAEKAVSWEQCEDIDRLICELKAQKITVIAVEQADTSVDYKKLAVTNDSAFIFGAEVNGIAEGTLALCDAVAEIPMRGKKESINVAVAAGVFLFRVLDV